MDLLLKDIKPSILPVLENNPLFQDLHLLNTSFVPSRNTDLSNPPQS
jgi:hypothetical protein